MPRLAGKVALITGAYGYLGGATARLFAKEGAKVVCAGRKRESLDALVKQITDAGGTAAPAVCDVTVEQDIARAVDFAVATYGRLDIMDNNAVALSIEDKNVVDTSNEVWDQTLKVVVYATVWGCKYAIPQMMKTGGGSIINVTSMSGVQGDFARIAYGTAKAGIINMTRYIATGYGKHNIRCNALAPGFTVDQEMIEKYNLQTMQQAYREYAAMPRLGQGDDIAYLALFLASDESANMTGQLFQCDAGASAHSGAAVRLHALETGG